MGKDKDADKLSGIPTDDDPSECIDLSQEGRQGRKEGSIAVNGQKCPTGISPTGYKMSIDGGRG